MARKHKRHTDRRREPHAHVEERPPRVMLVSLGCAKNTVDSELALGELLDAGFDLATEADFADLVLINTCAFIESARTESYAVIEDLLGLKRSDGTPCIVVLGCLPERRGDEIARDFPQLDGVWGLNAYGRLVRLCEELLAGEVFEHGGRVRELRAEKPDACHPLPEGPRMLVTPPSYAYLRLAEGCDNRCAYCTIPLIRGPFASRPQEAILAEAKQLLDMGVQELILVAQDTTSYGKDLHGQTRLRELLQALLAQTEAPRIRVMYAHPAHLEEDLLRLLGDEPRLCGYLDLPLQHVDDAVLRVMGRRYGRARIDEILGWRERHCPALVLRTTFLLGFPGETEVQFTACLDFVREGHCQHLGAFGYSPESDTPAYALPGRIAKATIFQRLDTLMLAQQEVAFAWLDSRLGRTEEVLIDTRIGEREYEGRTGAEAPEADNVIVVTGGEISPGTRIHACLTRRHDYDIEAILTCASERD